MKVKDVYFLKSCLKKTEFPSYPYPEFAFCGRSNVGKSSLINMAMGRKGLVKTGSRPGVTRAINFFVLNENTSIVDLPGYGYAKLPVELKKTFLPMIRAFFSSREHLKLAFLLIDVRRIPDDYEHNMIKFITGNRIPLALVLTKCDKLSNNQLKKNTEKIINALGIESDAIFYTSAKTGRGKKEILQLIDEYRGT